MTKKSFALFLALSVALVSSSQLGSAQTSPSATAQASLKAPLSMLPPSDFIAFVNLKRLIDEAAPKVFANNPAKLAEFNAHVDKLKSQTGIDARAFESVAVGMLYQTPSPGITTAETVVIARGTFNAGAIIAAGRLAAKAKYQEEKHDNAIIYIFRIDDHIYVPGVMNMRVRELAVTTLDTNTLVIGELAAVRSTLDAKRARGNANADLISLATRTPNALMGFSANVPTYLSRGLNVNNEEIGKLIGSIRQAYGAVGTTQNGFDMLAIARTEKPDQAQTLGDTISALKQFGGVLAGQLPADARGLAQNALDSLKIGSEGNEASIRFELQLADIPALMRVLQPKAAELTK